MEGGILSSTRSSSISSSHSSRSVVPLVVCSTGTVSSCVVYYFSNCTFHN